ncbi:polymorphic toxin type 44 domain-containing protein [Neptunomonas sp.]|uniref:polymorphic toxin type 44 domain-containing protein n=1 Tax=Neptunomonas sp. TaxID=1971898 RepID=UPI0025E06BB3|nr:polymorphic toxin type 44 domain-containing protein [Neptunomonas sp.]
MHSMEDLAFYMASEMKRNARSVIAQNIKQHNTSVFDTYQALTKWKSMVGNRRPWDHKNHIKNTYGEWSLDSLSGAQFNYDIWSNLHYGYVGRGVGFSAWTLKAGAGYAQWAAGTNPDGYWQRRAEKLGDADVIAAFDDPNDQTAITLGIQLWDSYKSNIDARIIAALLREHHSDLQTK